MSLKQEKKKDLENLKRSFQKINKGMILRFLIQPEKKTDFKMLVSFCIMFTSIFVQGFMFLSFLEMFATGTSYWW